MDDISFTINTGEIFALVGESGSGKSITALSILQLLPPQARFSQQSKILFQGEDLLALPEIAMRSIRERKIGMVFQEPMTALNPVLTIGYQLKEVLARHMHLSGRKLHAECAALLEQVGLPHPHRYLKSYPHQLSGGQRQRVRLLLH